MTYNNEIFAELLNDARKDFGTIKIELIRESIARVSVLNSIMDKSTSEECLNNAVRFHVYLLGLDLNKTFCNSCIDKIKKQVDK